MAGVWCTKILRPGAPRIGQIGKVQLPRTIPLHSLLAGAAGAGVGIPVASVPLILVGFNPLIAVFGGAMVGAAVATAAVNWSPWREESLLRAALVGLSARRRRTAILCPGAFEAPGTDLDSGEPVCSHCARLLTLDERGLIPEHRWQRRVYIGMMELAEPEIGETVWISGSEQVPGVEPR